jgi:hypothetical protein
VEKRTTIYIDTEDQEAIRLIQADHAERGIKVTESAAIRYALREAGKRLEQVRRRPSGESAKTPKKAAA